MSHDPVRRAIFSNLDAESQVIIKSLLIEWAFPFLRFHCHHILEFRCIVNLSSIEPRFAVNGLGSLPIVEPPLGVVLAVVHAHTQPPMHLAFGEITTVLARLDRYLSAHGQWCVRWRESRGQ